MTADDGRLYPSYISQGRDGPVYGRPQNMVDGTVRNTPTRTDGPGRDIYHIGTNEEVFDAELYAIH